MTKSIRQNVLVPVWQAWKRIARRIGDFQARVILTVLYFIVIAPFALAVRWLADPLGITPSSPKGWQPRTEAGIAHAQTAARQS